MRILCLLIFFFYTLSGNAQLTRTVDICVYGGTSAGVMAAYSAKKLGKSVLLIEPGTRLGGLTSGGLGYTDIGNKYAISGLALDFYRRIGQYYGGFEQWIFEPSVAERTFQQYINSAKVPVIYQYQLKEVKATSGSINQIITASTEEKSVKPDLTIKAKIFIDCSYEGDLMAKAGVSYTVGRESNELYGETYNGVQLRDHHQFPDGIDPFKIPNDPHSGLVWGISDGSLAAQGSGDKKVQAYNFRICLTNVSTNRIDITRPEDYDSSRYELLLRFVKKINAKDLKSFLKIDLMPNGKTDINNNGPFSTDMIGMNYNYPEADYITRKGIVKAHENYIKGLLYFIGHDPRMPEECRNQMLKWGYPKDEYVSNHHWTPQLYVREARRMIGSYVMTQANCEGHATVNDGVAMAAYTMDSHNCQRLVVRQGDSVMVKNEGNVEIGGFDPYPISYRSIVPKENECNNLLVPVCLSASHIAYGSIRMEPVFMLLAQSSAIAASLAIDKKIPVQQLQVKWIQDELRKDPLLDGSDPEILVDDADSMHVTIKGEWKKQKRRSYGPSMLVNENAAQPASVRFSPVIKKTGSYSLYTYLPKIENMSNELSIKVFDGKQQHLNKVKANEINVKGQTSGEWIFLGDYYFISNAKPYIEFSNLSANGLVVADAILMKTSKMKLKSH